MGRSLFGVGIRTLTVGACLGVGGCAYPIGVATGPRAPLPQARQPGDLAVPRQATRAAQQSKVVSAAHAEPAPAPLPDRAGVDDLVALAVARNPRLAKATFTVDAARGRHIQAGLYPNPDLAINWDEVGDRTGPGGILTAPRLEQTIVTGRKLTLAQAVAAAEIDRAALALLNERYAVIAAVRAACFDVLVLERRIETLTELVRLADEAVRNGKILFDNQKIARLDLVQLETERERFRAEAEAARRELPAARRALAAAIGDPRLTITTLTGSTETLPLYDADRTLDVVLATHPEVRSAHVGVERAQAAIRRAKAEVIPDVTIYTGYIRQDQNKSNDFALGASAPIPVWNRNQGNIRTAQAELGEAGDRKSRIADRGGERSPGGRKFAARGLRLRAEALALGFELNQIEPGDLLVIEQNLAVADRFIRESDEFVERLDPAFQNEHIEAGRADRSDDGIALVE